jgi:predicted nucleic acid-binding protein
LKYLLDTDVISQLTKDVPHPGVYQWVASQEESTLFLSVATLLEIRVGVEKKHPGKKRDELEDWLVHKLPLRFHGRIVPIEQHVADLAGRIIHRSRKENWGMDEMDAIIAATAMANDMGLATLNRKHFERLGVELVKF